LTVDRYLTVENGLAFFGQETGCVQAGLPAFHLLDVVMIIGCFIMCLGGFGIESCSSEMAGISCGQACLP